MVFFGMTMDPPIEAIVFRRCRFTLLHAITEIEILPIANALYSGEVIHQCSREEAEMTTRSPEERKIRLLNAIEATITVDSKKFHTLLDILDSFSLHGLREKMDLMFKQLSESHVTSHEPQAETCFKHCSWGTGALKEGLRDCIITSKIIHLFGEVLQVLLTALKEIIDEAENADSADEVRASVEESTESDDKEESRSLFSEYLLLLHDQKYEIDLDALQLMSEKGFSESRLLTSPTHKLLNALQQSLGLASTEAIQRLTKKANNEIPVISASGKQHVASQ